MGSSEITIARNYALGAAGELNMDTLPATGQVITYSVHEDDPSKPDYVADSAATATAWATGIKTSNGRISTKPLTGEPVKTILEIAQDAGFRTGNVTTAELTDATPAALASHVKDRDCQGPADTAACPGQASIAEQFIDHQVDVLLGGGKARFDQIIPVGQPFAGMSVIAKAQNPPFHYQVVTDSSSLMAADPRNGKLLGLFAPANMTTEWTGTLAQPFPGSGPQRCVETNRPVTEPSLTEMTRKALEFMTSGTDPGGRGRNLGFFLQVEGASIDKRDHAMDPCGQIGETIAFDKAIALGLAFAKSHPDTLIIVTADHAHTSQIIPSSGITSAQPGSFSRLITADNAEMVLLYATNPITMSQDHTGAQVPLAAAGPFARRFVGVLDQTELFDIMKEALLSW